MRLETQQNESYPATPLSPLLNREAKESAHRWLARFAPLLDGVEGLGTQESRGRLEGIPALRAEGQAALQRLESQVSQADLNLLETLRSSLVELDAVEADLRRRLGLLAPGDPEGQIDLAALQAKLAENAARREVTSWGTQDSLLPARLELQTSPPNWAAAAMMGLFSLGWNSFTTIHAVLFIGGFWRAIGPFALFFLLFYSMFWAVGAAMAWGAFLAACQEEIGLEGRRLLLTRKLFGYTWKREYTLMEGTRARLLDPVMKSRQAGAAIHQKDVAVTDEQGKEVRFASGRPREEQQRLILRLNEYLAAS